MRCASVQERLADEGIALVGRDAAIREHVAGCAECRPFLEALEQVNAGMSRLPPIPAPASLLAHTAKAVGRSPESATRRSPRDAGTKKLATALAATVILAAGFGLVENVQQELDGMGRYYELLTGDVADYLTKIDDTPALEMTRSAPARPRVQAPGPVVPTFRLEVEQAPTANMAPPVEPLPAMEPMAALEPAPTERFEADELAMDLAAQSEEITLRGAVSGIRSNTGHATADRLSKEQKKRGRQIAGEARRETSATAIVLGGDAGVASAPARAPAEINPVLEAMLDPIDREYNRLAKQIDEDGRSKAKSSKSPETIAEIAKTEQTFANARDDAVRRSLLATPGKAGRLADAKDKLGEKAKNTTGDRLAQTTESYNAARRFLAERERLTGLDFQSGSGYWANTYVPGDPAIRLLEARLQRWDRSVLSANLGDMLLEGAAHQNWQPFDVPENAALAVYLHADKRAVNGRTRLRVQVGLQGSQKRSGLRPDMNVGVVLDVRRPVDDATGTKLRALMTALARARQPGDRFSITVAGHPGGLLVAPEAFRNGPIRVAMQSLFTTTSDTQAPAMDLLAALHTASQSVRQGDNSSAPLGASLVLLVSTAPLGEQRESLERMVHENAVAGIGLSVVAVSGGADLASIDRLVLLGQGHRRVLVATEDAVQLVDRELHAASRAVARAVRLRIRLAPGVELIDVLGSKNLSEQAAQRVREAERSIDQRVARNIGIRADRGEDEEGIQIVIPSFFAGDSHAVLLDVVVPGPGPVVDVSVRYKDLVYRRNGIARARLAVDDGHRDPGPLERNVLKNQLAHELARSASAAGQQLSAGDRRGAVRTLTAARELIAGMRDEIPGWDNDNELRADEALLTQYLTALGSRFASAGQHRHHLADSLRYLAFRRLIPPHK